MRGRSPNPHTKVDQPTPGGRQIPLGTTIRASWPNMSAEPASHAVVEAAWQDVRDDGRVPIELLDAAYAQPRLRQLFVWTGMGELHFSRCTEKRWTWDIPYLARAKEGGYRVDGPLRNESVGLAETPEQAIAMVLDRLPTGCGPAFVGTPEELTAHEATRG